jgi:hypothetical protein
MRFSLFSRICTKVSIQKIRDQFDLDCKLKKVNYGTGCQISISQSQTALFYDIIGKCPVSSMEYKWK